MALNEEQWEALLPDIVYVLALEAKRPDPSWKWYEKVLDYLVQTFQPQPKLTHIELFIPGQDDVHFATYLGKLANWGSEFSEGADFYTDPAGNGPYWRAVPIMAPDAVGLLRKECNRHVGTPYGSVFRLFNYPFSVPPLRSLAWSLDDKCSADAHCAVLTMRCLRHALSNLDIPESSAWYGPSTAFLQMSQQSRMASYARRLDDMAMGKSTHQNEEATRAAETLLQDSDDNVKKLSEEQSRAGIFILTDKVIRTGVAMDMTAERNAQLNLARALLRDVHIRRSDEPVAL